MILRALLLLVVFSINARAQNPSDGCKFMVGFEMSNDFCVHGHLCVDNPAYPRIDSCYTESILTGFMNLTVTKLINNKGAVEVIRHHDVYPYKVRVKEFYLPSSELRKSPPNIPSMPRDYYPLLSNDEWIYWDVNGKVEKREYYKSGKLINSVTE